MNDIVAVDAHALTYFISAMKAKARPTAPAATEKLSLFRVSPTCRAECLAIPDRDWKHDHESTVSVLADDIRLTAADATRADHRAKELSQWHFGGKNWKDCMVVAESEVGGATVLLSFDKACVARLGKHTKTVRLMYPSKYWSSCNVPRGATPRKVPARDNSLSDQTWWRWE